MSIRVGIEIATRIQVMISFTVGWGRGAESTGQTGPGHNNTGTAERVGTPGLALSETVGQAVGEAESHQVDIESGEERCDPFVGITNGTIEEDDINLTRPESNIEVQVGMDEVMDISGNLNPGLGHEVVGVTDVEEAVLRAEEQAPPRTRWRWTRRHVPRGWSCIPAGLRCQRCVRAAGRRRERGQLHLLEREAALTREYLEEYLDFFEF